MTEPSLKAHENRLRDAADRQWFVFSKSKRRDPRSRLFQTYGLWDPDANRWFLTRGTRGWGMSLDEIQRYLERGEVPDDVLNAMPDMADHPLLEAARDA